MEAVTIVIPTYNDRSRYLTRILSYYAFFDEKIPFIIVADASSIRKRADTVDTLNNRIRLMQFPASIRPFQKVIETIREVQTKYVLFCADDDFITLNGIKESVKFLEENPDYSCAQGIYISFRIENNKPDNKMISWMYSGNGKSIASDQAEKRLLKHLGHYEGTFYGVHRTKDLLAIFDETIKVADDYRFMELMPSMLTAIHGKIKILEVLYGAREELPISQGQSGQSWLDVINDDDFRIKYNKIKLCLARHLHTHSSLGMGSAGRVVEEGLQIYLSQVFGRVIPICIKHKIHPIIYRDLPILLRRYSIFYPIRAVLRVINRQYNVPVLAQENKRMLNEFLDSSPENRGELLRIEKFILDSLCQN